MNRSANKSFGYKLVRRACNADWASESDVDDSSGRGGCLQASTKELLRGGSFHCKQLPSRCQINHVPETTESPPRVLYPSLI